MLETRFPLSVRPTVHVDNTNLTLKTSRSLVLSQLPRATFPRILALYFGPQRHIVLSEAQTGISLEHELQGHARKLR